MKGWRVWLWLGLLLLVGLGVARLRFDVEILNLLPTKLPVAEGLKRYQQSFSDARELILTVEGPSEEEVEGGARALAELLRGRSDLVAEVTWQPPWLEHPALASEMIAALWLNQPPEIVAALTNRLAPARWPAVLAEAREQMATSFSPDEVGVRGYDPFGLMRLPEAVSGSAPSMNKGADLFVSADGRFRLLFVESRREITSYRDCRVWLQEIKGLIGEAQRDGRVPASLGVAYTGRPAFVNEIAGGMESDMTGSVGGTLATIGILFWLAHRRLRPLVWLLFLLLVILAGTTALGGLFLGTINVISMGFACILAGLAEDFGIVIYQESRSHPEFDATQLRRQVAPGIFWSAVTTAGAFLILNLSTLPGLGQLGSLVAIGILLAAAMMIYGYLPLVLRWRRPSDQSVAGEQSVQRPASRWWWGNRLIGGVSICLFLGAVGALAKWGILFDRSPNVLKPRQSEANAALEQIKARFGRTQEPFWVLVPGRDESEVGQRLREAERALDGAVTNGLVQGYTLPSALWPEPARQEVNRVALGNLARSRTAMLQALTEAGFTTNAGVVTASLLDTWTRAAAGTNVFWPTNAASHWILRKIAARTDGGFLALGPVHPSTNAAATARLVREWPPSLRAAGVDLSGWELLGTTVFSTVMRELPLVIIPIFLLVVVSLWLAFGRIREVILSLVTLGFSALLLGAAMALLGWRWNILNIMALPLLLGMGVDFSIHMLLALRRHQGDRAAVHGSVGRALLLAGATTIAGFGSLAFSSNAGMASLGQVCALGIAIALATAVWLLPVWWIQAERPAPPRNS